LKGQCKRRKSVAEGGGAISHLSEKGESDQLAPPFSPKGGKKGKLVFHREGEGKRSGFSDPGKKGGGKRIEKHFQHEREGRGKSRGFRRRVLPPAERK